jgi:hypothetical protein
MYQVDAPKQKHRAKIVYRVIQRIMVVPFVCGNVCLMTPSADFAPLDKPFSTRDALPDYARSNVACAGPPAPPDCA